MQIFLVRHGDAAPGEGGPNDDLRPLTPKGRREVRALARAMERIGIRFDALHHSPLLRAVETAELLTQLLDGRTFVDPWLAAVPVPELALELEGERVALVGHQPHLGDLAALLAFGYKRIERPGDPGALAIGCASVCTLAGEPRPGGMRITGLYSPRALRELSKPDAAREG